jgi:hypothetical protein
MAYDKCMINPKGFGKKGLSHNLRHCPEISLAGPMKPMEYVRIASVSVEIRTENLRKM